MPWLTVLIFLPLVGIPVLALWRGASDVQARVVPQRVEEAGAVGVVPHQAIVPVEHAVHRAQLGRHRRRLVDRAVGGGLVGHGHQQPAEVQRAHGLDRGGTLAGRHLQCHERPVRPGGGEGGVEDGGRQRVAHRPADHRGEPGGPADHAATPAAPRGPLRRCTPDPGRRTRP